MASGSDDSVTNEFQNNLGRLRSERLAALGEAAGVHAAMQALLQHEARRIESKLGPQHPRTEPDAANKGKFRESVKFQLGEPALRPNQQRRAVRRSLQPRQDIGDRRVVVRLFGA